MKHLWEVDHAYYCNLGNYFAKGSEQPQQRYRSWADFMAEEGDSDMDYNLLFRWDWKEENRETGESTYNGDNNYRNGVLYLFWIGQRKGLYRWSEVEVCRADEPLVRAWLNPRMQYLFELWEPIEIEDV